MLKEIGSKERKGREERKNIQKPAGKDLEHSWWECRLAHLLWKVGNIHQSSATALLGTHATEKLCIGSFTKRHVYKCSSSTTSNTYQLQTFHKLINSSTDYLSTVKYIHMVNTAQQWDCINHNYTGKHRWISHRLHWEQTEQKSTQRVCVCVCVYTYTYYSKRDKTTE